MSLFPFTRTDRTGYRFLQKTTPNPTSCTHIGNTLIAWEILEQKSRKLPSPSRGLESISLACFLLSRYRNKNQGCSPLHDGMPTILRSDSHFLNGYLTTSHQQFHHYQEGYQTVGSLLPMTTPSPQVSFVRGFPSKGPSLSRNLNSRLKEVCSLLQIYCACAMRVLRIAVNNIVASGFYNASRCLPFPRKYPPGRGNISYPHLRMKTLMDQFIYPTAYASVSYPI